MKRNVKPVFQAREEGLSWALVPRECQRHVSDMPRTREITNAGRARGGYVQD